MPPSGKLCLVALVRTDVFRLLVTANVVPSSPSHVTLTMEAIHSSETSFFMRAIRRNIPEDGILHSLPFSQNSVGSGCAVSCCLVAISAIRRVQVGYSDDLQAKKVPSAPTRLFTLSGVRSVSPRASALRSLFCCLQQVHGMCTRLKRCGRNNTGL
jgi:hypothetical protein